MDFRRSLISSMGYISDDQIPDAIKELGADFLVVQKNYVGPRRVMELGEINRNDPNIRSVFVDNYTYGLLKDRWGM